MLVGMLFAIILSSTQCGPEEDPTKSIAYMSNACQANDQDFYELVSWMEELREYLISQGAPVPRLTAILEGIRDQMSKDGLKVNDAIFDRLQREFEAYEAGVMI